MRGLLALSLLVALGSSASGQFIDFQAERFGLPLEMDPSQSRLLAMGGLFFVIPDENREINLADFAGNVAGVASDKDGWSLEWSYLKRRTTDDALTRPDNDPFEQRAVLTQEVASGAAVYRNDTGRALGGSFQWVAQGLNLRVGDDSKARGPNASALWNESLGSVRLGTSISRWSDNEDVNSADIFAIRHFSTAWTWNFGAATELFGLEVAGQIDLQKITINGRSRDPSGFHQDDFEWFRPARKARLSLLLPEGSDLELGVNLTNFSRSGREEAEISWSNRFPNNPGGFNYEQNLGTFEEDESGTEIEARALYWLGWAPRVGAYFRYGEFSSDVVESSNFIGSRRAGSLDEKEMVIGGGAATSFADGRFTLGIEGQGRFATVDETLTRITTSVDGRDVSLRGGLEWFGRENLALRAGYEYLTSDSDTSAPFTLQAGNAVSVGVGYVPEGAIFSIDGFLRYLDRAPVEKGGANRETDQWQLGLSTRMLF